MRLAVDLVNTFHPISGTDDLGDVEALRRFLDDHDLPAGGLPAELTEEDLETVRWVRRRLRAVFEAPDEATAADQLNRLLAACGATPKVALHGDSEDDHVTGPHLHFEATRPGVIGQLMATAAMGLAVVLCEYGASRLGVCRAGRCRDVFIDMSRNQRKRYCSDNCAHRASVAAFRARKRAETAEES